MAPTSAFAEMVTIPVTANGNSYSIDFEAEGIVITSVQSDMEFRSLIFGVEVTETPGILTVTFDRDFFDSMIDGVDVEFIILADGDEPKSDETITTLESRTLRIELPSGTEEIEIIGEQLLDGTFGEITIVEEPVVEEPVVEEPVVEEPVVEEPVVEEPVVEEPVVEEPVIEELVCGEGTMLKDGQCVLDERCGSGTHFVDGQCVLDEKTSVNLTFGRTGYSELVVTAIIGFGIAFAVIIVFAIIARGRKKKNSN